MIMFVKIIKEVFESVLNRIFVMTCFSIICLIISHYYFPNLIEYGLSILNVDFSYLSSIDELKLKEEKITKLMSRLDDLEKEKLEYEILVSKTQAEKECMLIYMNKYEIYGWNWSKIALIAGTGLLVGGAIYYWLVGSDSNMLTKIILKTVGDTSEVCNTHTSKEIFKTINHTSEEILKIIKKINLLEIQIENTDDKIDQILNNINILKRR